MTMTSERPRTLGFSSGTEELRWQGKPALISTAYLWAASIVIAVIVSNFWDKLALTALGSVPVLRDQIAAHGLPLWAKLAPWLVCLWPIATRTLALAVTVYELTSQRVIVKSGILVRMHDQVELFRVRDFMLDAPIYLTILGLANVRIISRDETLPLMTFLAQPNAEALIDTVRAEVQRRKDEVGIREIETGMMH